MARLDPAIRHAITPPEFGENMLHREHLVDRLHGEIPRALVAIAAPAGYGKTTLLADFVQYTEIPVCWVRVSEEDQDAMRLASVLLASLETRFRRLRDTFDLRAFSDASPVSVARGLIALIEENVPETFVLVLDDVHHLNSSADSIALLDEILVRLPENVVAFAAGREVLEVSLARLMAEGRLAGIGPHDLALSSDEANDLTALVWDEPLNDEALGSLMARTRGWVTGIVLSNQSETRIDLSDGLPEGLAYEYLANVVLNRLPEMLRKFLMQASVLPILTPALCDEVLGYSDSAEILREAYSKGLFLTSSRESPTVYEIHPMFRELLSQTLAASDPMLREELLSRAALALEGSYPEQSIQLYLELGEYGEAKELTEELAAEYYQLGRFETLKKWHVSMGQIGGAPPNLKYFLARMYYARGEFQSTLEILGSFDWLEADSTSLACKAIVLRCFVSIMSLDPIADAKADLKLASRLAEASDDPEANAFFNWVRAYFDLHGRGDLEQAARHFDTAIQFARSTDNAHILSSLLRERVGMLLLKGNLPRARNLAFEVLEMTNKHGSPVSQTYAMNELANIEYLQGDYEDALRHYEEASGMARLAASHTSEALVHIGIGEVFSDCQLKFQAAKHYSKALEIAGAANIHNLVRLGCLSTSILHRRSNNYSLANQWLDRASEVAGEFGASAHSIERAAILAHSAPEHALRKLFELEREASLDVHEMTSLRFWITFAHYRMEAHKKSVEAFRELMSHVDLSSTHQPLAAELLAHSDFHQYLADEFGGDPVFETVEDLIDRMVVFRDAFAEPVENESSVNFSVEALGHVELHTKDGSVEDLKPQALEFLIYLLDRGAVDKDRAGAEFWPDHPPGRQTANLHMAVYSIRKALGKEVVQLDGNAYRFEAPNGTEWDVREFERASEVARRLPPADPRRFFALTEAVRLYKGPFMPEYFSNWVQERRTQLELDYLDLAADLAEEALRRDQPKRAVRPIRQALQVDPYREDLNISYLQLLRRLNRRTDVISHYLKYSDLLRRDFGLEPADEAKDVHSWAVTGVTGR